MSEHSIGKITIADGVVVIQRDNQLIELQEGDSIYLNDIIEAKGGSVGIAFKDETTMSIDAGSKMVVDEFVYDPEAPTTGSMNANILSGNFSFVSGQIAKVGTDAMTVTTPVLTIGVRGTQVAGKASQEGEANQIVLLPNEDGTVGQLLISNQSGTVLLTRAFESTTITSSFMPPTVPVILPEDIVLKKFGKTINTTRRTEKKAKEEREESKEEEKEEYEEVEEEKEEEVEEEVEEDPFEEEVSEEELEELEEELEEEIQLVVDEEVVIDDDIFEEEPIVEEQEDQPVVEDAVIEEEIIEEDVVEEEDVIEEEIEDDVVEEEDAYVPPVIPDPDPPVIEEEEDIYVPPVIEDEEDIYVPPVIEDEDEEVNEAPTFNTTSTTSIAENVSSGSSVVTMSATDPNNDSLIYSISSGNDAGKFTIDSSTGAITLAASLDYETTTSYTLTIQVSDGSLTATTNQVVNITDVNEATTYTQGISNTSIDAWGARYSHDMVLNNAWAEGKALVMHGDRSLDGATQLGGNLGDTQAGSLSVSYDNDSAGNFSTMSLAYVSQFSQIWDGNWDTRVNSNSDLTDLWGKYIMAGGSLVVVTENSNWDSQKNADVEDFINVIDTTSSTNAGLISGSGPTPQHLQPDYLGYSEGGSELSLKPGTSTSTYHKEYMGRGDLVFQETSDDNDGAVAEWSREDTESVYTGAFLAWGDIDGHSNPASYGSEQAHWEIARWLTIQNKDAITEDDGAEIVIDSEYIPIFGDSYGTATHTSENDITAVESFHLGNNVYIGGGMDHIDFVWDDSADAAYWAFNADMDNGATPTQADDHYGVIGSDADGDGDLWETTDTFSLDKIKILDDSEDYLTQDSDATGDYYFKVTPVTYSGGSWNVEYTNTVTLSNTTDYNDYYDLSSNSNFDDINYALIETESALISEIVVSA